MLNARETQWWERPGRGVLCEFEGAGFEGATDFEQLGINLTLLGPGEPMAMYHRENDQEDFLVLDGEALLVVEGQERPLRRWDLAHCPAGTNHVIVGAGDGPCLVLAVGAKPGEAYQPRSWEMNAEIPAMFDRGEHEKAKKLLTEALPKYEDKAGMLYNIACAEALLGETDEALGHLREALEKQPQYAESAREDPDFEPIRSDPRFAELVGV